MEKEKGKTAQQRAKAKARVLVSVDRYAHLHNMLDEILGGDNTQLKEFQQMVQHASVSARESLLRRLDQEG